MSQEIPGVSDREPQMGDSHKVGSPAARCPVHAPGTMLNPLSFEELASGSDEVWIEGGGQLYRLRQTKQNKLILTK
ncbi:hemin uptake protein HemP [Pirellulaceae bacterium SH449]